MGNCCKLLDQSNNKIKWDDIDEKSCEMLSFKGDEVECKVVSVYDGDTIKVVFPLGGHMYKWNCRISGVDTPELRTRCKLEKQKGYEVRDKLRETNNTNLLVYHFDTIATSLVSKMALVFLKYFSICLFLYL